MTTLEVISPLLNGDTGDTHEATEPVVFFDPEARTKAAEFIPRLLPDFLDIANLAQVRKEIIILVENIRRSKSGGIPHLPHAEEALVNTLQDLEKNLRTIKGVALIDCYKNPIANDRNLSALWADYGLPDKSDDGTGRLLIPTDKITAAKVLALPLTEGDFHPAVDMRIQTTKDVGTSYYNGPGEIISESSLGHWFRFEVESTGFMLGLCNSKNLSLQPNRQSQRS